MQSSPFGQGRKQLTPLSTDPVLEYAVTNLWSTNFQSPVTEQLSRGGYGLPGVISPLKACRNYD